MLQSATFGPSPAGSWNTPRILVKEAPSTMQVASVPVQGPEGSVTVPRASLATLLSWLSWTGALSCRVVTEPPTSVAVTVTWYPAVFCSSYTWEPKMSKLQDPGWPALFATGLATATAVVPVRASSGVPSPQLMVTVSSLARQPSAGPGDRFVS